MLKLIAAAVALVICCSPASAADARPSETSVKELLEVTQAQKQIDGIVAGVEGMLMNNVRQFLGNRPITPAHQKIVDSLRERGLAFMRQELARDRLDPFYIRVYQENFTQAEVNGMLVFYKSPAGRAVINKMPIVMQAGNVEMQNRVGTLIEKVKLLAYEAFAEIEALEKKQ